MEQKITLYYNLARGKQHNSIYLIKKEVYTIEDLKTVVSYDHVCAEYRDNHRSNSNFIQANCSMFDIDNTESDNCNEWVTPQDIQKAFPNVPFYVSYSRNHMKQKGDKSPRPKFHVYFPDITISDSEEYKQCKEKVCAYFSAFDQNAKDAARFFFGVENPKVEYYDGNTLLSDFIKTTEEDMITEGNRNNHMFRYARKVLMQQEDENKAYEDFINESKQCSPALDNKELNQIWTSALKYPAKKTQKVLDIDEWEMPIPFQEIQTPDFPTDCLPDPVAYFVKALAESTQTPEEMAGILSLGVLATAFQSRFEVEITPDWTEPLCLYTVAVAPPAERKSAVINALTKPAYNYEYEKQEAEKAEIAQNQTEKELLEKELQAAKKVANKSSKNRERALALSTDLAEFKEKYPFRLFVDDTTVEVLTDIMSKQNGCITVASSEGGVFTTMTDRYGKNTNFDIYLKGHAGDTIKVDRIGRDGNSIKKPRLTMVLTIQPEVLDGLMANDSFRGRGLCGRFLYSVCKSKIGYRNVDPSSIPRQIKEEYNNFIARILSDTNTGMIRLDTDANDVRLKYQSCIEKRLINEWEHIRDWAGKLMGATMRIAALLHAANIVGDPTKTPINADTMTSAIKIAEYLGVHAMAAYQVMGADKNYQNAKYLLEKLKKLDVSEINKNNLFDLCKGKTEFKKGEGLDSALQILEGMHYIKVIKQQTNGKGRPPQIVFINPAIKNSKNSEITISDNSQ